MWGPGALGLGESLASDMGFSRFPLKRHTSISDPSNRVDFLMIVGFLSLLHGEVPGDLGVHEIQGSFLSLYLKKAVLL